MRELMTRVYWSFGGKVYASYEGFVADVTAYNRAIDPESTAWDPDQVIATGPIKVVYEALWKDEDDTIAVAIGSPGIPLTMGRCLFTLNNATVDFFKDVDTHFFEGLMLIDEGTYELWVGS
jgi:hypothetical protein